VLRTSLLIVRCGCSEVVYSSDSEGGLMISKYRRSAYDSAALVIILLVVTLAGCSHTNSVEEQLPYYVTPASALDPQPDAEMLRYLLDSSTFHIGASRQTRD